MLVFGDWNIRKSVFHDSPLFQNAAIYVIYTALDVRGAIWLQGTAEQSLVFGKSWSNTVNDGLVGMTFHPKVTQKRHLKLRISKVQWKLSYRRPETRFWGPEKLRPMSGKFLHPQKNVHDILEALKAQPPHLRTSSWKRLKPRRRMTVGGEKDAGRRLPGFQFFSKIWGPKKTDTSNKGFLRKRRTHLYNTGWKRMWDT